MFVLSHNRLFVVMFLSKNIQYFIIFCHENKIQMLEKKEYAQKEKN